MRKKKRTTVRQTVMQIVIGSKPPSELLEDVLDTCTEWYTAAGGWILALMLVGPFVWVGWCALALNYLEFIGAYYPMLLGNWLWLCLVVGFFSVPILATFSYLDKKTQFIAILLEEEVPAKIPGSDKVELKEEKNDMEKVVSKSDESLRIESVQDVNDWPEDFGRVAPQLQDKVTGEYSTKPERMRVEHDQVFSATGYQWRQKPEQLVMEKDVKPIVNEKQHKLQEEAQEADVLGPDTRSPFLMMSEEQKRMARLRAFGLVHSILVLAFVWIITEVYMRVNYDIDFHTIRSYGLWLASGFRGLLLFAFTTTMTGFAIVASRFFMKKSKSKRRVRRPLPPSPQVSDAESHSTQVPAIDETLDKITPKGSGKGKDEGREALFWMVCVGLNLCTVQGLAALLFYTPVWARSLIGPA